MIASVLKRNLFTKRFWLMSLLAACTMFLCEADKIYAVFSADVSYTALYIIFRTNLFTQSQAAVSAVMAGACALSFCEDMENRYNTYSCMRTSPFNYGRAWIIGNLITVLLATFFAYLFLLLALCTVLPLTVSTYPYENNFAPYDKWIKAFPPIYILILSFTQGCNNAFLSMLSMIVLTKRSDRYVAIGVPVVLQQLLYWCSMLMPNYLDYYSISTADNLFDRGPIFHLCYTALFYGILFVLFGMIFIRAVEKNHHGGKK